MFYKEYREQEDGLPLAPHETKVFESGFIPAEAYPYMHRSLVIACHDAIVEYEGKALLVVRIGAPGKGLLSPVGGRMLRGISLEESMHLKIREETGLTSSNLNGLGITRQFWREDPFGHQRGTDTLTFVFYARGRGKLKCNKFVSEPLLIAPHEYTQEFRTTLHPYTADCMDLALPHILRK